MTMFNLRSFLNKSREPMLDLIMGFMVLVGQAILSIPLALAIFVALMIWLLPEAIGPHQSWADIASALNRADIPHELFADVKLFFTASWIVALFVKMVWMEVTRNISVLQKRYREKRDHEANAAVRHAVEKLEINLSSSSSGKR